MQKHALHTSQFTSFKDVWWHMVHVHAYKRRFLLNSVVGKTVLLCTHSISPGLDEVGRKRMFNRQTEEKQLASNAFISTLMRWYE
jgi:hypothetical protein